MDLKWAMLLALIIQNTGIAIVMRYTFILAEADPNYVYISSTAVLTAEVLKLFVASLACFYADAGGNHAEVLKLLHMEFVENRSDFAKLTVPSFLYTVQNTLQYFSMSRLSAPVFLVLSQMKIVTTAVFSVLLLSREITRLQWVSILTLPAGVALVQVSQLSDSTNDNANSMAGLMSVIVGCVFSGFAGVYFEMVIKSTTASIWLRNIQLSIIGIVIASLSCLILDGQTIYADGFFSGYNVYVWMLVGLQAAGGLLVAAVVMFADNIVKTFATSLSIVFSALISLAIFDDIVLNADFVVGSVIVLLCVSIILELHSSAVSYVDYGWSKYAHGYVVIPDMDMLDGVEKAKE